SSLINTVSEILTVTNEGLLSKTKNEYARINTSGLKTSFILEPFGRNTAAAVAVSALYLSKKFSNECLMLILPADHTVADQNSFIHLIEQAIPLAAQLKLVTFGALPNYPDTGYGYIQYSGTNVKKFAEKPNLETAKEYIASGDFLWNSGMFCFSVQAVLSEMKVHCPEILEAARKCMGKTVHGNTSNGDQIMLDPGTFQKVPAESFDYAVMEKTKNASVVSTLSGWSDVGNWQSFGDLYEPDEDNNHLNGDITTIETYDSIILSDSRVVGTIGVENMIIIDTPDALLITKKDHSQKVGKIFRTLELTEHQSTISSKIEIAAWGKTIILEESHEAIVRKILVNPNQFMELTVTTDFQTTWFVLAGNAKFATRDKVLTVVKNESFSMIGETLVSIKNEDTEQLAILEINSSISTDN
ncbi:sugar phosphate nucleotidyltransferase, partial [Dehalococcoidia bacterium]|nr:sugar phosphate nucleotidyltransferase [Dehalococcoidia bacterium]